MYIRSVEGECVSMCLLREVCIDTLDKPVVIPFLHYLVERERVTYRYWLNPFFPRDEVNLHISWP